MAQTFSIRKNEEFEAYGERERYYGSDFYVNMYTQVEQERDTLKRQPHLLEQINENRRALGLVKEGRKPMEFVEIKGERVGKKNKSIFKEKPNYGKTGEKSEYAATVGKWEQLN